MLSASDGLDDLDSYYISLEYKEKHGYLPAGQIRSRPNAPWYSYEIRQAKQERRRAERRYRKTKTEEDRQKLREKGKVVNDMCSSAKENYYGTKISENESKENFKELLSITSDWLMGD